MIRRSLAPLVLVLAGAFPGGAQAPLTELTSTARLAPATAPNAPVAPVADDVYADDLAFALDELEKKCGHFFDLKGIDWKKVRKEMKKAAKKVKTDADYHGLMWRLLARLEDGHASVKPGPDGNALPWPEDMQASRYNAGFAICKVGKKYYVRDVAGGADNVGLEPGMQIVKVDGIPAQKWVDAYVETLRDTWSYSTDQHALFHALCLGMGQPEGHRIKLELKDVKGKKKKRTVSVGRRKNFHYGIPFHSSMGLTKSGNSLFYGKTERGYGYMHIRWIKGSLLEDIDNALAALGDVPGMILDFRGNSGGGTDHDALEARFVPAGYTMRRMARSELASQGANPYGGKLVVIVNGTTVSAGETTSGMFKEDGRAYMIGESATAGMSSQKETIPMPSGKCSLYVSVRTNRSSFNQGRGIEGIGVAPNEIVEFDPEELAQGVDSLIRRAEDLLDDFPQSKVAYDPDDYR